MIKDLFRYCNDIGMFASDRPINDVGSVKGSCDHRTSFCDDTCYNVKLYRIYPNMGKRDERCEREWQQVSGNAVRTYLSRKKKQIKRARHMTRGEAIKDLSDIYRVKDIALATPDTTWWIPTRAWRNTLLRELIQIELFPIANIALNASLDPSNTQDEEDGLIDDGWNIMYYGDDTKYAGKGEAFKCPKTWKKMSGHCAVCKAGCFSQTTIGKRVTVHLSSH
jgi:hypothetical protein|tara:strand:+ start:3549 stop:4214 length:666 start_codon:yes stop_codon:yes gene_type:complete